MHPDAPYALHHLKPGVHYPSTLVTTKQIEEAADKLAFLVKELGMKPTFTPPSRDRWSRPAVTASPAVLSRIFTFLQNHQRHASPDFIA